MKQKFLSSIDVDCLYATAAELFKEMEWKSVQMKKFWKSESIPEYNMC